MTKEQSRTLLLEISEGKYNEAQVAVFMGVYMMRSVTVEELEGFRDALLELCVPIDFGGVTSTDLCGTGGDGKNTFNISTTTSFVLAGAGYKVTKHGNYGVSSICGSSNVMEHLGYKFTNDADTLRKQLEETNICLLHAPLFHPAMKYVAPIRRALGVKTFFNMLGPLVNPVQPSHQTVGVYSLELATLYQHLFQAHGRQCTIIHALDGYDEISLTDKAICFSDEGEQLVDAHSFDTETLNPADIYGGDTIEEASKILVNVLQDNCTAAQKEVVLANAALAINNMSPEKSLVECKLIAQESIESGKAYKSLDQLVQMSN